MSLIASAVNVQLKSILIATDFSQASEKPLCHALGIARCYGAKLYLANVVSSLGFVLAGPGAIAAAEEAACRDAARLKDDLVRRGALSDVEHQVVVRRGEVWRELEAIIRQENIDLVVVGTHGRRGLRQFVLGSVAEQIFRHADCLVLTVGPRAYAQPRIQSPRGNRTFLLATDLGDASLDALQCAVSLANRFEARLVLLSVIPPVPASPHLHWCTASCLTQMQEEARTATLQQLEGLIRNVAFEVRPEFHIEFESANPVSQTILKLAENLSVDLVVMGLHRSTLIGTASHMPGTTAYEVVCRAGCPVLTVRSGTAPLG